jgi:tetratricopeptide (TPR) repeat protein
VHIIELKRPHVLALLGACGLVATLSGAEPQLEMGKVPITTSSQEARALYLKGRHMADTLRAADAREFFRQAIAKDPGFARAYFDLAVNAGTAKEFFDPLKKALALADKVSEPERLMILGLDAGSRGDVAGQKARYTKLLELCPKDERAFVLMGNYYFGQQDFPSAIKEFEEATTVNPAFSQPYNQLGYSYRFLGKFAEAEKAFRKYIELIPSDPNPYDSYAELLMKTGRFEESIKNYEKALSFDRNFVNSYVGIGNDQVFGGHGADARATYARLTAVARSNGERRLALFWSSQSYVHEGATAKALDDVTKMSALARADGDGAALYGDQNLAGNILLESGDATGAAARFALGVEEIGKADVPAEVKAAAHRTDLYDRARVALAKGDVASARALAAEYGKEVAAAKSIPFEVRRGHELAGRVALAGKDYAAALAELPQAGDRDPRVLYLTALAWQGKGDLAKAREACQSAADFNELNANYAYVRANARALLAKL